MANHNLLSLDKVRNVESLAETSVIESSSGHFFRPSTDHGIIEAEKLIFAVNFSNMSLNNPNIPTAC
jgi:hypothetical protein